MPTIDFSDVKGLDPVPEDWYPAEVSHAEENTSKAGNPQINLRWKLLEGDYEGRVIFDNLTWTVNSLWRVKSALIAMGYDAQYSGEVDAEDLVGRTADIYVVTQPSTVTDPATGELYPERNSIKKYRAPRESLEGMLGKKR